MSLELSNYHIDDIYWGQTTVAAHEYFSTYHAFAS